MSGWLCETCGMVFDWHQPNHLLALQNGDTANEQVVSPACGALDGDCDHTVCVLKVGHKLSESKQVWRASQGPN